MPSLNQQLKKLFGESNKLSDSQLAAIEKVIIKGYKGNLSEIQDIIGRVYLKFGNDVNYAQMSVHGRLDKVFNEIANELRLSQKTNINLITNGVKQSYAENYYFTGYTMETTLQKKMGFQQIRPETLEYIKKNPIKAFDWTDSIKEQYNDTYRRITKTMSGALQRGYGYQKTAEIVKKHMEGNANKALQIVRTESHRVQSQGRLDAFDKSEKAAEEIGVKTSRVWDATADNRTRLEHLLLDGAKADKDGFFDTAVGKVEGPGLSGDPGFDINCRCVVQLQLDDYPPEVKRNNEEGKIVPYKDYEKWKKERIKKLK